MKTSCKYGPKDVMLEKKPVPVHVNYCLFENLWADSDYFRSTMPRIMTSPVTVRQVANAQMGMRILGPGYGSENNDWPSVLG